MPLTLNCLALALSWLIFHGVMQPVAIAGPNVTLRQNFSASTQPRCLEETMLAESMALSMDREELRKSKLEITWNPPLKGKWGRLSSSEFLWENQGPGVPGKAYQAQVRLVPLAKGSEKARVVRVLNFNNSFAWCGAMLDSRASGHLEVALYFTYPVSKADLEQHVAFSIQGHRKPVHWKISPDLPLEPRALLAISEKEIDIGLELTIAGELRAQGTQVTLKSPIKKQISLAGIKARLLAAQRRISPQKLSAKSFQPKLCERYAGTDFTEDYNDFVCYYNGEEIDGSDPMEARAEFFQRACQKKQPFLEQYLQCFEAHDLPFVKP